MELILEIMKDNRYQNKYLKAKSRVDRLRGFYVHVLVYIVVNLGISCLKLLRNIRNGESFFEALVDSNGYLLWLLWGIGLALHAFSVFGIPMILGKNWEEDKIEEFMKKDQQDSWN